MGNFFSSAAAGIFVPVILFAAGFNVGDAAAFSIGFAVFIVLFLSRRKGGVTSTVAEVAAATMNKKDEIAEKYQELRKTKTEKV